MWFNKVGDQNFGSQLDLSSAWCQQFTSKSPWVYIPLRLLYDTSTFCRCIKVLNSVMFSRLCPCKILYIYRLSCDCYFVRIWVFTLRGCCHSQQWTVLIEICGSFNIWVITLPCSYSLSLTQSLWIHTILKLLHNPDIHHSDHVHSKIPYLMYMYPTEKNQNLCFAFTLMATSLL